MRKERKNRSIECCRLIAALMIVYIHCPIDSVAGAYIGSVSRAAVPFFLILSGYYAYGISDKQWAKKLKDTLRIVILGGAVCLIWNSINSLLKSGSVLAWTTGYINMETLVNLITFNRANFSNAVFYYFFMLIYVYLIYRLTSKLGLINIMYYMIIPLLAISFYVIRCTELPWYYAGNWMLTGVPFFFIGHFIHAHKRIETFIQKYWAVILGVGCAAAIVERELIGGGFLNLGAVMIAVGMLALSGRHPMQEYETNKIKKPSIIGVLSWLGSNCSLYIILFHCQILNSLEIANSIPKNNLLFTTLLLSLLLALAICAVSSLYNALSS